MNIRIIPRLDIKGPNLIKGVHLEGLRVLGNPEEFARHYYENGADELVYMDVVASLYGRNSLVDIIKKTSREIFIPLTVGGGLRSLGDIREVLQAGADKVSLNTAVVQNPEFIREASRRFGSSTIVVSIEAIKNSEGRYEAYTDNGRESTGLDVFEWALKVAELGAGEIMLTSINREGTGKGFDLELTRRVSESVPIPVIACGGAGSKDHVLDVIREGRADAVSLASMLHYNFVKSNASRLASLEEGNIEYLKNNKNCSHFEETTLPKLKEYLVNQGLNCRHVA